MYATPSTPGTSGTVLTTAFVRRSITCKSPAGRQEIVIVVIDGQIVEALAGRPWKVELGDLPQRMMACCRLGDATA